MKEQSIAGRATPSLPLRLPGEGGDNIVLLEDDPGQIAAIRKVAEQRGFGLLAAGDWRTAVSLAEAGARLFILDIKLGDDPERVKAGLNALAALRRGYDREVFAAVLTALRAEHAGAIEKLHADIAVTKTVDYEHDLTQILSAWEEWKEWRGAYGNDKSAAEVGGEIGHGTTEHLDVESLFPSDALALRVISSNQAEMAKVLRERRTVARAIGEKLPTYEDLLREIGARMREELRGALFELSERSALEAAEPTVLVSNGRLTKEMVRLIFQFLPVTYGADKILEDLAEELLTASRGEFVGEWGRVYIGEGNVLLAPYGSGEGNGDVGE